MFKWVGQVTYKTGYFTTPFIVAQDRHGRWWDCTLQHVLAGRLIDSSLREWLDARLTERGLKDLMDGELSWRVLDYRSENFIQEVDRMMSNQRAKGRGLFGRFRR